jgi:ZU5 domain
MRKLVCLLVLGCSSGAQINITKSVGAEGGTVSGSDGTSVDIPMGALAMSANITITSVTAQAPAGTVVVGPAYDFGPDGTTFAQPVTITLPFDSAKIPSGSTTANILIYTAARGSTNYQALSTTVSGNTVQTTASHFTVYLPAVPVADNGPQDLGSASCNPSCSTSAGSCDCAALCGSTNVGLHCTQSTTGAPFNCTCTYDGSPGQSFMISTCSTSDAQSAFLSSCAG